MTVAERVAGLLAERRPGHSLPQAFYNDPEIYAFDLEAVWYASWLMVGFTVELPQPGSYMALTVGRTPIVVLRDRAGEIRGFFNSCRHRGAQLCEDGKGRKIRIVCPYHQWAYDLDGKLAHAGLMEEGFDKSLHGLKPIHVEIVAGAIYVCLADEPPEFSAFRAQVEPMLAPYRLEDTKLAYSSVLVEKANWKLVMENGRECYHCAVCHPELAIAFPVDISENFSAEEGAKFVDYARRMEAAGLIVGPRDGSWWQSARFPFNDGAVTLSMDGKPCVTKPILDVDGGDVGSLRFAIEPHNFTHALGDYVFMFSAYPVGPEETHVVGKWLVNKDAVEGVDYTIEGLTTLWDRTNLQDRALAENNQRGVNGLGYVPGPYSKTAEPLVMRFVDWYCNRVREHIGGPALRVAAVA